VAYFPDNDFASHTDGPQAALATVEQVDGALGRLMQVCGGLDSLLDSLAVVVTGDHAQSDLLHSKQDTEIDLGDVLKGYSIVDAGTEWGQGDELMICPNMRAAQIYLRPGYWSQREDIIRRLVADERIDQVLWRDDAGRNRRFSVLTRDRGRLEFEPASANGSSAVDEYGTQWAWRGNLEALDVRVTPQGTLEFGKYPNAFERIAMAFDDQVSGDLWITSRLGREFRLKATSVHRRGSHGSLHIDDSLSPLFMAGFPAELLPQKTPRSVDVAPLCLSALGLKGAWAVGAGHVLGPAGAPDAKDVSRKPLSPP
jgi:hypothetical protein